MRFSREGCGAGTVVTLALHVGSAVGCASIFRSGPEASPVVVGIEDRGYIGSLTSGSSGHHKFHFVINNLRLY